MALEKEETKSLQALFLKDPYKSFYWLALAFIIKALYFIWQIHLNLFTKPFFAEYYGHTLSYFKPIENLIATGHYTPDFCMPGYGIIYLPLIYIFSHNVAYNLLAIIQLLFSSASVYLLALSALKVFKNNFLFYAVFFLYTISTFSSAFDYKLLPESLSTSTLIFSVYYFVRYINDGKKMSLVISGLFITWMVFLCPTYMALLVVFVLLLITSNRQNMKNIPVSLFLFIAPFIIIESAWIAHNYVSYKKIIPTTKTFNYPEVESSYLCPIWEFERAWGMDDWRGNWLTDMDTTSMRNRKVPFPKYIYTSIYNEDSLKVFKEFITKNSLHIYTKYNIGGIPIDSMNEPAVTAVREKCNVYIQSIKTEKPFLYYIRSHWSLFRMFCSKSEYSEFNMPVANTFFSMFYLAIMAFGFFGLVLLIPSMIKFSPTSIFPLIPLCSFIIYPVILSQSSNRYFIPSYPFMLVCGVYALQWLYNKSAKRLS